MNNIGYAQRNNRNRFADWRLLLALSALGLGVGILQVAAPQVVLLLLALGGGAGYMFLTYLFPFAAFAILIFLALTVWLSVIEIAFGISLMVAVGLTFAAVWLWRLAFAINSFVKVREYALLLALVVMIAVSNLFNWGGPAGFYMTFTYLQLFLLFVLVVNLTTTAARLHSLGVIIVVSSTLIGGMILLDQVGLLPLQLLLNPASNILVEGGYTRVARASGLWGGPNMTAVQLTMALPFLIEWRSTSNSLEGRLLLLGAAAVIIAGLVFTFSVGGMIGVATILFVREISRADRPASVKAFRIIFAAALVTAVLSVALPDLYRQRFAAQFVVLWEGVQNRDERLLLEVATERGDAWFATVQAISQSLWVGHGPGNVMAANAQHSILYFGRPRAPHNMFLSIGSELGLPGLTLFALLLFLLALKASLAWREKVANPALQQTGRAVFVALAAFIVQGMALDIQNLKLLWILLGMAAVYGRLHLAASETPQPE